MKHFISRAFQCVYTIYVLSVFITTFFIQLPFFFFFSMFGQKGSRLLYLLLHYWAAFFFFVIGMPVRVQGKEKIESGRQYIVVANHQSFLDTPLIFRSVPFPVKPLARSDFGRIPLFGFMYRTMTVPVDRGSEASKRLSVIKLRKAVRDDKVSIFIFPEGSFNETDRYLKPFFDGAFRIAKETDTEILPIIFPDTAKRWHYSSFWKWNPGICRAVILDVIDAETIKDKTIQELKAQVWEEMEFALMKIDK